MYFSKSSTILLFISFETLFWYFAALGGFITIVDDDIPNWLAMVWELGFGIPIALLIGIHFLNLEIKNNMKTRFTEMYHELSHLKHLIKRFTTPDSGYDPSYKIAELDIWRTKKHASYFSNQIFQIREILCSSPNGLTRLSKKDHLIINNVIVDIAFRMALLEQSGSEL